MRRRSKNPIGVSSISPECLHLLARIRAGETAAEERLLHLFGAFLNWRRSRTFVPEELVSSEDLMQEFRIAFICAARKWNPDGGACFTTYLFQVLRNIESRTMQQSRLKRKQLWDGSPPEVISLDQPVSYGEESLTIGDFVPDPEANDPFTRIEDDDWLRDALDGVPPTARALMARIYGLDGRQPMTLRAYAAEEGRTFQGLKYRILVGVHEARKRMGRVEGYVVEGKRPRVGDLCLPRGRS